MDGIGKIGDLMSKAISKKGIPAIISTAQLLVDFIIIVWAIGKILGGEDVWLITIILVGIVFGISELLMHIVSSKE